MSVYPHKGKNVLGKDKNFVLQQYGRSTQTFKAQMYLYIHIRAKTYLVRTKTVLQQYRRFTQSSQESSLFYGTDGTNPKHRRGQRKNDKLHSNIILLDLVGTK